LVRVDIVGVEIVGRQQGRLNKVRIPNDDGFVYVDHWGGWWRSRRNACLVSVEGAVQPCQVGVCKGIGWLPFLSGGAS
jgi:hypothetical protein